MRAALAFCLVLAAGMASAQVNDPMRPPGGSIDATAASTGGSESGVSAIFLRRGAKPAALVNGVYVVQGGKLGDRRVLKITESGVVLKAPDGSSEVMKLMPGIQKQPVVKKQSGGKSVAGTAKGSEPK